MCYDNTLAAYALCAVGQPDTFIAVEHSALRFKLLTNERTAAL